MSYLDTYKNFIGLNKVFFVKFYKEYEGDGGYWDAQDNWVSGDKIRETLVDQKFYSIEDALKFADYRQDEFLKQEQFRAEKHSDYWKENKLSWMSNFDIKNVDNKRWEFIQARINWGGSNIRMVVYCETY